MNLTNDSLILNSVIENNSLINRWYNMTGNLSRPNLRQLLYNIHCTKHSTMLNIKYLGLVSRTLGPQKDLKDSINWAAELTRHVFISLLKYYFTTNLECNSWLTVVSTSAFLVFSNGFSFRWVYFHWRSHLYLLPKYYVIVDQKPSTF